MSELPTRPVFRAGRYKKEILETIAPPCVVTVFDTETTGLKPEENDRVIEFSCMTFDVSADYSMAKKSSCQIYIKPPFPVEPKIEELTGITNAFLSDKPTESDVDENGKTAAERIYDILSSADVCVGHNVGFDIKFINALMDRNKLPSPFGRTADTLKMARDLLGKDQVENHKNETLVRALGLTKGIEHFHSALDDVLGTSRLLQKFLWAYRDQKDVTISETVLRVYSVKRWEKEGSVRIYVNTDQGSIFFGTGGYIGSKAVDVDRVDKNKLIADVLKMTGIDNIENILSYGG